MDKMRASHHGKVGKHGRGGWGIQLLAATVLGGRFKCGIFLELENEIAPIKTVKLVCQFHKWGNVQKYLKKEEIPLDNCLVRGNQ